MHILDCTFIIIFIHGLSPARLSPAWLSPAPVHTISTSLTWTSTASFITCAHNQQLRWPPKHSPEHSPVRSITSGEGVLPRNKFGNACLALGIALPNAHHQRMRRAEQSRHTYRTPPQPGSGGRTPGTPSSGATAPCPRSSGSHPGPPGEPPNLACASGDLHSTQSRTDPTRHLQGIPLVLPHAPPPRSRPPGGRSAARSVRGQGRAWGRGNPRKPVRAGGGAGRRRGRGRRNPGSHGETQETWPETQTGSPERSL